MVTSHESQSITVLDKLPYELHHKKPQNRPRQELAGESPHWFLQFSPISNLEGNGK
jgi:hypothetical protein